MKKILIIGGNGYVGSRLINDYKNQYNITNIDLCWYDKPISECHQIDYNELYETTLHKFDIIILLAGHSSVKMCNGSLTSVFNNNVKNFINLISKLKPHQKFIYASSSSVYGDVGTNTVNEEYNGFVPHNNYDITKYTIDLYAPQFDVQYYGLRFGTVNGYSPIVRNDVMINAMTYNSLEDKEIKLFVKDIVRPILGISDLSRAIKCIIDTEEDHRGIYNLASFNSTAEEIAYGVNNITKAIIKEQDAKLDIKPYNFSIDSSKFKNTFNFEFKETIESITKEIINNFDNIIFTNRNQFKEYE
jgi:nucleoside-diphosphate-sugar epimerase